MVLAASSGSKHPVSQVKESIELFPSSNPLEHLKKVWQGFCDPRGTISPEDDNDNKNNNDDEDNTVPPASNHAELTRSVEQKETLERCSTEPIRQPPTDVVSEESVAVVTSTGDDETEVEVQITLEPSTKFEEALEYEDDPSSSTASSDSGESDEKLQDSSASPQKVPIRARRIPYVMEATFVTLVLLVATLLALGRMGYNLDFEFRFKAIGEKTSPFIITNASRGGQIVQTAPQADHDSIDPSEEINSPSGLVDDGSSKQGLCEIPVVDILNSQHQPPFCVGQDSGLRIESL